MDENSFVVKINVIHEFLHDELSVRTMYVLYQPLRIGCVLLSFILYHVVHSTILSESIIYQCQPKIYSIHAYKMETLAIHHNEIYLDASYLHKNSNNHGNPYILSYV